MFTGCTACLSTTAAVLFLLPCLRACVCVRVRACMQVATVRLWVVVDNFKERAKLSEKAATVIFCDLVLTQSGAQRSKPGTGPVS